MGYFPDAEHEGFRQALPLRVRASWAERTRGGSVSPAFEAPRVRGAAPRPAKPASAGPRLR